MAIALAKLESRVIPARVLGVKVLDYLEGGSMSDGREEREERERRRELEERENREDRLDRVPIDEWEQERPDS